MSIYVEIEVAADLAKVWEATQDPKVHQRWDLRFTEIDYLPKHEGEPQRFTYSTKLGFGLKVAGLGESIATKSSEDAAVSSLKFWSDDLKSLIKEGSGYWKYESIPGGTKFLTGYDYRTRFGFLGSLFDKLIFRPLIAWATAWSFDSMRIWVERGVAPEDSRRNALIHLVVRLTLAFVWIYQGLVPKLLFRETGELATMQTAHLPLLAAGTWVTVVGILEIVYGVLFLALFRNRWVLKLQILVLTVLTLGAMLSTPKMFIEPFNPITLNLSLIVFAAIALLADDDLPSAKHCMWKVRSK